MCVAGVWRLQGVRNLLTSAIWGVPYAQVMEEGRSPAASLADMSMNGEDELAATTPTNRSMSKEGGRCVVS